MAVTTFAAPILPGKTEAWKQAVAEMVGPRKNEYEESRRRLGITREVASLQQTPQGDFVVVFLEGDDPATAVSRLMHSNAPYDRWFAQAILRDLHGMEPSQEQPPPNQVFLNYAG